VSRDPRYDILFEPVQIGPVTTRNRFYQVPHCTGMGSNWPNAHAELRGQRAEGGWGVVCTEEVMIHPTTDELPGASMRLWDDDDIPVFAAAADKVHEHGGLFGVELVHGGLSRANKTSRTAPLAPSHQANKYATLPQARGMDLYDIDEFRRWHREAAIRAKKAGADIVYVYCAHNVALPMHFLLQRYNRRRDAYGGKLENRARLLRELLEDTKDAVGDSCAVALRFAVDERIGEAGLEWQNEGREVVEMLAELPDLWDVNVSGWENDSKTSRFAQEGFQEDAIAFVKSMTTKPVVGVGRYTSPDSMVRVIKSGIMDLIGAARPAIADSFLPKKIEEGRAEDIRECIGCNICVSGNNTCVPMRCTQNPVVGEEWRRGWHTDTIPPRASDDRVLIVGAGPAGLEAARALGQRGYDVTLAERTKELGGRLIMEAQLPGLAAWMRVRDWRLGQIQKMPNVKVFLDSFLDDKAVTSFGAPNVVFATGSSWRRDGVGNTNRDTIPGAGASHVHGPDDVMEGRVKNGPVVIFDDDHHTMGGLLAEKLAGDGLEVILVTPSAVVSEFTLLTLEQAFIQSRLIELGVDIRTQSNLVAIGGDHVCLACTYTGRESEVAAGSVVLVTSRLPNEQVYHRFAKRPDIMEAAGIKTVALIGDCLCPQTIASAVHDGHLYARELGTENLANSDVPYRRERMVMETQGEET
jgi:dimethylamine/trimethylamine dehydrogenase